MESTRSYKDCSIESDYDADYYQDNIKAWAKTDKDEYEIEGKVLSLIPLRNKRENPEGEMLTTRITEGMTGIQLQRESWVWNV